MNLTESDGINAGTLKRIAIAAMLVDHIAACVLAYVTPGYRNHIYTAVNLQLIYQVMRNIGRTAFPIFCFLLVEGFHHTNSRYKYLGRLFLFFVISEIPYDLARRNVFLEWKSQNVFLTLAIGLVMMIALHAVSDALDGVWNSDKIRIPAFLDERMTIQILRILILATCGALFIWIGDLVRCDYGGKGIRLIMIFYLLRQYRSIACVVGYSSFMWEAYCFPAFLLIPFYNGRRGAGKKYVFYLFYPVHIIALYFIRKVFLSYVG